jgi:hypothetical protein
MSQHQNKVAAPHSAKAIHAGADSARKRTLSASTISAQIANALAASKPSHTIGRSATAVALRPRTQAAGTPRSAAPTARSSRFPAHRMTKTITTVAASAAKTETSPLRKKSSASGTAMTGVAARELPIAARDYPVGRS